MSKWGNHITFENEMGFEIDSLQISICDDKTMIIPNKNEDGTNWFGANVSTPKKGFPCPVKIEVFSNTKIISLIGDDFNCNHCDIDQRYRLTPQKAVYEYSP